MTLVWRDEHETKRAGIHNIKPKNRLMLKTYCLRTIFNNAGMFRSVLIIFRDWLNNTKAIYCLFTNNCALY